MQFKFPYSVIVLNIYIYEIFIYRYIDIDTFIHPYIHIYINIMLWNKKNISDNVIVKNIYLLKTSQ